MRNANGVKRKKKLKKGKNIATSIQTLGHKTLGGEFLPPFLQDQGDLLMGNE